MSEKKEKKNGLFIRLLIENPVFGLYLGICSALAITTNINNAIGMGLAVTVVLTLSNILVSLIRNMTPADIHIPVYIVIIATLVTIVGMLIQAYTPSLYTALGAFIDLIVVNCIILGRAEAFASMNPVVPSIFDGLTMGASYTLSILAMSFVRQILGTGMISWTNPFTNAEVFAIRLIPEGFELPFFKEQFGAFITFACLATAISVLKTRAEEKEERAKL